jgi:hypothetical protein
MPSGRAPLSLQGLGLFFTGRTLGPKEFVKWVRSARFDIKCALFYENSVKRGVQFANCVTGVGSEHEKSNGPCPGLN